MVPEVAIERWVRGTKSDSRFLRVAAETEEESGAETDPSGCRYHDASKAGIRYIYYILGVNSWPQHHRSCKQPSSRHSRLAHCNSTVLCIGWVVRTRPERKGRVRHTSQLSVFWAISYIDEITNFGSINGAVKSRKNRCLLPSAPLSLCTQLVESTCRFRFAGSPGQKLR